MFQHECRIFDEKNGNCLGIKKLKYQIMKNKIILISLVSIILLLFSCKKEEPETITKIQTITVNVTDTVTTYILTRHAEVLTGSNPNLSTAGQNRANELKRVLKNVTLSSVYSTNYNRTMQTATPTANDKSLTVKTYDPFSLSPFVDSTNLIYKGKTILVVGHSNTTPSLLNTLTGSTTYSNIPESEYDNLYVVTVFEKGRANVTHMKYGN